MLLPDCCNIRDVPLSADFTKIADLLHEVLEECKAVQGAHGKLLKDFNV